MNLLCLSWLWCLRQESFYNQRKNITTTLCSTSTGLICSASWVTSAISCPGPRVYNTRIPTPSPHSTLISILFQEPSLRHQTFFSESLFDPPPHTHTHTFTSVFCQPLHPHHLLQDLPFILPCWQVNLTPEGEHNHFCIYTPFITTDLYNWKT